MGYLALIVASCVFSACFADSARTGSDLAQKEVQIAARLLELSRNETFVKLYRDTFHSSPRVHKPFTCPIIGPSPSRPTSVHALRPGDINVVAALGDSLTAGRGAAGGVIALLVDYRGLSWSIGGDDGNSGYYNTIPNILMRYNPNLYGYSTGQGDVNSRGSKFNVATTGDESRHMPGQAQLLVERLRADPKVDFENDWKLITLFIGGNDLCDYCNDEEEFSPEKYEENIQTALDYLHNHVPRAFVNLVEVINIEIAKELASGLLCQAVHIYACNCASNPRNKEAEEKLTAAKNSYRQATLRLATSGRYDTRDDFTVVLQPFYRNTQLPRTAHGGVDYSYFASDCFHYSEKGQEAVGEALWNNMFEPEGNKKEEWSPGEHIECPTEDSPYLFTSKNSPKMTIVGGRT